MSNIRVLSRQHGISIVESLVALVVLSVGMLGIASLYIASLKADRSALVRTQAVNLAIDIADRIRSNRAGKDDYATAGFTGTATSCVGTTCTAAEIAKDDLKLWQGNIKTYLPNGATGTVVYAAAASKTDPNRYTITVEWPEQGSTEKSKTTMVVEL
jgi:type IV pilus assembly protein PilV